jgi:hypothetical protein
VNQLSLTTPGSATHVSGRHKSKSQRLTLHKVIQESSLKTYTCGTFRPIVISFINSSWHIRAVEFPIRVSTFWFNMILVYALAFIHLVTSTEAFPMRIDRDTTLIHDKNTKLDGPRTEWSRQDILTLIGVCVAVAATLTAILIAAPRLREWLCEPLECKPNPNPTTCAAVFTATRGTPEPLYSFSSNCIELS